MLCYNSNCCLPGEFRRIVSQEVPRELYAQHFTRNPLTASLMFRVLLDIHCPNTFLLAFLFQIPSVISSVQLKGNSRQNLDGRGCRRIGSEGFSSGVYKRHLFIYFLIFFIFEETSIKCYQKQSMTI